MHRQVLWTPQPGTPSQLKSFKRFVENRHAQQFGNYDELWKWSVDCLDDFWKDVWDYCNIIHSAAPTTILDTSKHMNEVPEWFTGARLNYAENLLRYRDDHVAIIATGELSTPQKLTYTELCDKVEKLATTMRAANVKVGDRVAAFLPNTEHAIVCVLASAAIGAVFSSTSPDFGVGGTLHRLGQIQPKLLFCVESVFEDGKQQSQLEKLVAIVHGLPSLETVVFCDNISSPSTLQAVPKSTTMKSFLALAANITEPFHFEQLPFDHPLVIMFTSGSTGKPKCLVHGAGGLLLQHRKEHLIHTSMSRQDKFFYYTTTGWMMWNWQVSALAEGATLVLFSGKPFLPTPAALFKIAADHKVTKFGVSAKYIQSIRDAQLEPHKLYDLSSLDTIYSTGSPLSPEGFDFIYQSISPNVMLSSITGGTDICSLFGAPNTDLPVVRGQVQCRGLGMAVDVWDEEGKTLYDCPGELVCTKPMPCMPIYFLNDEGGARYRASYFSNTNFPHVWFHGDYVRLDSVYKGLTMLGRSDGTLNPKGIRFGSADLYAIVEEFPEVADSLAVGYKPALSDDEVVVMFLKMAPKTQFTPELSNRVKIRIHKQLSAGHVPAIVMPIEDIPYTISGKKPEVVIKRLLSGVLPTSTAALRNPESILHFLNLQFDKLTSSAPVVPFNDEIAMAISKTAASIINKPDLAGEDFSFSEVGFDSLNILRVKMFLGDKYHYLIDAHALLQPGTTPTSVSRDIREAAVRRAALYDSSTVSSETTILTNRKSNDNVVVSTKPVLACHIPAEYELSLSSRRMAGLWVFPTFRHIPILPHVVRRRVAHEYFVHYLETIPLAEDGQGIKYVKLMRAMTRLCELHPVLRTRLQRVGARQLSEPIAQLFLPYKTTARLNEPTKSFDLVKVSGDAMYDLNALNRYVRRTFSGGRRMMVVAWNESCSFVVLGIQHMVFDMETREIYFDHLKKLYQSLDRKDVYSTRLMDWPFVLDVALSRFQPLPMDIHITRVPSKFPIFTTMDYFTIHVKIPKGQNATVLMVAAAVGLLQLLHCNTTSKGQPFMGFLGVTDISKEGYSGNGTVEIYSVLEIPKELDQQSCLAAFKSRRSYLVMDHVKNLQKYAGVIFVNLRVRTAAEPEVTMRSLCSDKLWPNNGGSVWIQFDIWPENDVMMISFWVSHNLRGGLHKTFGSRAQHFLRHWGLKSEMTVSGNLPVLG
ncbi:hypothetical protein SeLEV6574_g02430 [Synchytrium endobioticum]|uniref:Acetoacetate--CoA ligase n=1 Tax=Synchytrium endobioticum TaxID=286115 RepID=A0A507DAG7_9FUNG|nr:hypothetical protein SeLEV6574_g02430 [Synchytrium endobioticum]